MKALTEKAKNGEYYGIVVNTAGKEVFRTATTFIERHYALARANSFLAKRKKPEGSKKSPLKVGDAVATPKGAGVLRVISPNFAIVQISGAKHTFMTSQIKAI